jgi:SAM-dependent methyltransferase
VSAGPPPWAAELPDAVVSDDPGSDVPEAVDPADEMYDHASGGGVPPWHYKMVGRSALRNIRLALAAAGRPAPQRILDLPCGHGRVLRVLRAAFPDAELHACDLNAPGVQYCATHFRAVPIVSHPDPAQIPLRGPYDAIWVGSLLTHLDAPLWRGFLQLFRDQLAPGGVCVVTGHGRRAAAAARAGSAEYGVPGTDAMLAAYDRTGFGYAPYPGSEGYGVSLASPAWVFAQIDAVPGLRLVSYTEHGWAGHQDAIAVARELSPSTT